MGIHLAVLPAAALPVFPLALTLLPPTGHLEVLKLLVARGADVMCKDKKGYTLLHTAAASGQIEVVRHLLRLGVEVSPRLGGLGAGEGGSVGCFVAALPPPPPPPLFLLNPQIFWVCCSRRSMNQIPSVTLHFTLPVTWAKMPWPTNWSITAPTSISLTRRASPLCTLLLSPPMGPCA